MASAGSPSSNEKRAGGLRSTATAWSARSTWRYRDQSNSCPAKVPRPARRFSSAGAQGRAGRDVERGPGFLHSGRSEVGAPGRDDVVLRSAGVDSCIACLGHPKPVRPMVSTSKGLHQPESALKAAQCQIVCWPARSGRRPVGAGTRGHREAVLPGCGPGRHRGQGRLFPDAHLPVAAPHPGPHVRSAGVT
jgi:hypothetical protein